MHIEADNIDTLWTLASRQVLQDGEDLHSRDGGCRELTGVTLLLTDPTRNFLQHPFRKLSAEYACAELLWYLSGKRTVELISSYAPSYMRFTNSVQGIEGGRSVALGAYGHRWRTPGIFSEFDHQIPMVIKHLKERPNSRQAVVSMWNCNDLVWALRGGINDLPCTLGFQFLVRNGRLDMITTMRSNDLWRGTPYDIFCFTSLQRLVAEDLGCKLGTYRHHVGSLHVYERERARLEKCVADGITYAYHEHDYHPPESRERLSDFAEAAEGAVRLEASIREGLCSIESLADVFIREGSHGTFGDLLLDAVLVCAYRWLPGPTPTFPNVFHWIRSTLLKETCLART